MARKTPGTTARPMVVKLNLSTEAKQARRRPIGSDESSDNEGDDYDRDDHRQEHEEIVDLTVPAA